MQNDIYFTTPDNIELHGVFTKPKEKTNTLVIMCHGITVDCNEGGAFSNLAAKLKRVGVASFRFDFRSHGKSQGNNVKFSPLGEIIDLETAYKLMRQRHRFEKIILLAASFAGGITSIFAAKHKVQSIVFWNPTINYKKNLLHPSLPWTKKYFGKKALDNVQKYGVTYIGSRRFKIGRKFFDDIKKINSESALLSLSIPILFIHGDKDKYAVLEDVKRYSQRMENANLVIVENGKHGLHNNRKEAEITDAETIKFIQSI